MLRRSETPSEDEYCFDEAQTISDGTENQYLISANRAMLRGRVTPE